MAVDSKGMPGIGSTPVVTSEGLDPKSPFQGIILLKIDNRKIQALSYHQWKLVRQFWRTFEHLNNNNNSLKF
jgi:hypothetical protein